MGAYLWRLNLKEQHAKIVAKQGFWSGVFQAWRKLTYRVPTNATQILEQNLWYNSNITIGGGPMCNYQAIQAGFNSFEQILDDRYIFLSYKEVCDKLNKSLTFLRYKSTVSR